MRSDRMEHARALRLPWLAAAPSCQLLASYASLILLGAAAGVALALSLFTGGTATADLPSGFSMVLAASSVGTLVTAVVLAMVHGREWRLLRQMARQLRRGDLKVNAPTRVGPGARALAGELAALAAELRTERTLRNHLTRDIAHEFRTPLAVLGSQVEAIQDGIWAPTMARMELCAQEIGRLAGMVEDLEHLADAEMHTLTLERAQFSLRDLLDGLTESFEPLFARKHLDFRYDPPAESLRLHADRGKVGRIIINLLSNAYKYTPDGGTVALSAWQSEGALSIGVADTGAGIAAPEVPRVFDRSFRGRGERLAGGSGLGLTIARALAEAHGGHIEVYSEADVGSEFTVVFPTG